VNPVITRPATSTDAPAIADFFNDIARAAGGDPWFMIDPVAGWFTSGLIRDPLIDSRVMIADGIVVAAGMIAPPSEDEGKVDAWGGVRPEWRGRGLGRSLLGWQWDRAVALCPPGASREFDADCYLAETDTIRLFERVGLEVVRYWFEMGMPLTGLTTAPVPSAYAGRGAAGAWRRRCCPSRSGQVPMRARRTRPSTPTPATRPAP
jgi:mycothiol synthase